VQGLKQAVASKLLTSYFDQWYSVLVRYAYQATGCLPLAEDLVQGVYLGLYRELRQGVEITQPKAWLFCVLRHEITKQRRADHQRSDLAEAELDKQLMVDPVDDVPPEADIERLFTVLSAREQEVVLLRLASLKYREIAQRLGISTSTVNTLLARAIRKLRWAAKARAEGGGIHAGLGQDIHPTLQ